MQKILMAMFAFFLSGAISSFAYGSGSFVSVSFEDLKGWGVDQGVAVRTVLLASCQKLRRSTFYGRALFGSYKKWKNICHQLSKISDTEVKEFFEKNFTVYRVAPTNHGLFTGYYSPVYEGRLTAEPGFEVPLLKVPGLRGKGGLKKSDSRAVIEQKIIEGKIKSDQVLVWIKSSVDKFFLQIQGSGQIRLKDGTIYYVGYAGNNGRKYVSIGRVLKNRGALAKISMSTIRGWLESNPDKQQELFNENPRYIFFEKTKYGAITAQGIPATAYRTMAVDPKFIPYGTPLWVDTELTATKKPFRQMMVAQDTGGAIKGLVRGDIYMGAGAHAEQMAGEQQALGKLYVIVPK
ncbi:MAG: MltA domain-containing protein [Candidatus Endonucleobacter bathymodioli]|uniref:Membrane-bound lytic murein transglycosylase A n=1 Tax=Candidatus Endonucleibacter bathymodioli TaxID=539814 RepID=A0AA90NLE1_9GAMM|nr:MltA domain-containing protein [Candidatus Endonucleobacter bathymodioli]